MKSEQTEGNREVSHVWGPGDSIVSGCDCPLAGRSIPGGSSGIFVEVYEMVLRCMWESRGTRVSRTARGLSDFRIYCRVAAVKQCSLSKGQRNRSVKQERYRNKPRSLGRWLTEADSSSSERRCWAIGRPYAKADFPYFAPYTKVKIGHIPNCKT